MAEEYRLPKRLLSEAQEVLLHHGFKPKDSKEVLRRLCVMTRDKRGGVPYFHSQLDEIIKDPLP